MQRSKVKTEIETKEIQPYRRLTKDGCIQIVGGHKRKNGSRKLSRAQKAEMTKRKTKKEVKEEEGDLCEDGTRVKSYFRMNSEGEIYEVKGYCRDSKTKKEDKNMDARPYCNPEAEKMYRGDSSSSWDIKPEYKAPSSFSSFSPSSFLGGSSGSFGGSMKPPSSSYVRRDTPLNKAEFILKQAKKAKSAGEIVDMMKRLGISM